MQPLTRDDLVCREAQRKHHSSKGPFTSTPGIKAPRTARRPLRYCVRQPKLATARLDGVEQRRSSEKASAAPYANVLKATASFASWSHASPQGPTSTTARSPCWPCGGPRPASPPSAQSAGGRSPDLDRRRERRSSLAAVRTRAATALRALRQGRPKPPAPWRGARSVTDRPLAIRWPLEAARPMPCRRT